MKVAFVNAGAGAGTGATITYLYPGEFRLSKVQLDLCGAAAVVATGSCAVYVEQQIANAGGWTQIGKFHTSSDGHLAGVDTGAVVQRALATDTSGAVNGQRSIRFRYIATTAADELSFAAEYDVAAYE